jgi:signal peptidase
MTFVLAAIDIARRVLDLLLIGLILVVLASLAAARVLPAVTGAPTFVVAGGSMEPTIHLGSVAVDSRVTPGDLAVGDVVSIRVGPAQSVFTHRITRLVPRADGLWIETKGDANSTVDPSIIPSSDVVGRVSVVVPGLGYVVQLLSTFSGVAFLTMLGIMALLGTWLLESLLDDLRVSRRPRPAPVGMEPRVA